MLYKSITPHSLASARTFTSTLCTKRRAVLAGVTALTLLHPAPRDFEDFWSPVAQRCPHITHLTLSSADLDSAARTTLRPHHLSLSFPNYSAVLSSPTGADLGFWSCVSHLHLPHHPPHALLPLLNAPTNIPTPNPDTTSVVPHLSHFSCYMRAERVLTTEASYDTLRLLLRVERAPALRVCIIVRGFRRVSAWTDMFFPWMVHDDRRLVVLFTDDVEQLDGEGAYWELAERTIAGRG
ncbi:hypothetical protein C8R45DRAFT_604925 [Mycena sanguinolenta]|nr:hypothetical protein C8R45DRAFT_604925 [Mycena sanguinolenta]